MVSVGCFDKEVDPDVKAACRERLSPSLCTIVVGCNNDPESRVVTMQSCEMMVRHFCRDNIDDVSEDEIINCADALDDALCEDGKAPEVCKPLFEN